MAINISIICAECGERANVAGGSAVDRYGRKCYDCIAKEEKKARKKHFAELDALSLEERIRRIEEWIYDYRPPISIRDLTF